MPRPRRVEILPSLEALKHLAVHAEDVLRDDVVETPGAALRAQGVPARLRPDRGRARHHAVELPLRPSRSSVVAAALAAGNTVVLKPAPATTLVGLRLGVARAGRPASPTGVVNVVAVDDAVAPRLVEDPRVAQDRLHGQRGHGQEGDGRGGEEPDPGGARARRQGRRPSSARTPTSTARPAGIVWGAFLNAGQTCASVERVYVETAVAEPFLAQGASTRRRKLRLRRPRAGRRRRGADDPGAPAPRSSMEHVEDARGARRPGPASAARPEGPGYFYPPTVLAGSTTPCGSCARRRSARSCR